MPGLPYGDPQRPDVIMGPSISEKQRTRVLGYIEKGVDEGATLASAGTARATCRPGWYVEPTLFTDVDNSMTIAQEEIFGPVLVVIPFDDDDDAVQDRQRQQLRPGRHGGSRARSSGPWRWPTDPCRRPERQRRRRLRPRCAVRRLQGQRHRPAERHWPGSTSTSRPSQWPGRPAEQPDPTGGRLSTQESRGLAPPALRYVVCAAGQPAAMPTTGWLRGVAPADPSKGADP